MSDEEKLNHVQLIEETINTKMDSKLKPIFWMVGAMLTIFVTVSVPLTLVLISTVEKVAAKADTEKVTAQFDKADKTYLQKWDYYQIEEDEHRVMKEIIKNPIQTDYLMGVINNNMVEQLGFKLSNRGAK